MSRNSVIKENSLTTHSTTRVRNKVKCSCKKCRGKMVDPRTRNKHEQEENQFRAHFSKSHRPKFTESSSMHHPFEKHDPIEERSSSLLSRNIIHYEELEDITPIEPDLYISSENEENHNTYPIKKRRRVNHYRKPNEEIIEPDQSD